MKRMIIPAVALFAAAPMAHGRSCIVDAGTQTYAVSSACSAESTVCASRTVSVQAHAAVTETRRYTTALSSAGSLCTVPLGSVLILR